MLLVGCPGGDDEDGGKDDGKGKDATDAGGSQPGDDGGKTDDDAQARKPDWWRGPGKWKLGLKWPPPRPKKWPPDRLWPPLREVGDDPGFWTDLYGEYIDAKKDKRLGKSGEIGNERFRYNFREIGDLDVNVKPGCGLHILNMGRFKSRDSCTPYPEAEVRGHCELAFDEKAAERKCRRHCARNERRCRQGRLFPPPIYAYWRCATFKCFDHEVQEVACPNPSHQSDCFAFYLCDCYEI